MGKHTPAAEQRRLVDLWLATDASMASFARAHGARPGSSATWIERHRAVPASRPFFQLAAGGDVPIIADEAPDTLAVVGGDHALRLDVPPPPAWFAAVLRALAPC